MAYIEKMKGQEYIDSTRLYLDYVEKHLENVRRAFCELSDVCDGMWWVCDDYSWHSLRAEVECHDTSKFSRDEFVQYRDTFYPVSKEDRENSGMKEAWEHHKALNHHHHESLKSSIDVIHMIIDWTAMGYEFGGTAQEYYEENSDKIKLSPEHKKTMYEVFDKIKGNF